MKRSTKIRIRYQGASRAFLPCRAAVVCPDPQLRCRGHPTPPQEDRVGLAQAQPGTAGPLVLACLRKGGTFAELAAGSGLGTATAWRYVTETAALLAARARHSTGRWPARR